MKQYIDKSALIAEIKKIYNEDYKFLPSDIAENIQDFKDDVLRNIDSQEVKEVDLEKIFNNEYSKFSNDIDAMDYAFPIDLPDFKDFAKHFFELGIQQSKNDNDNEESQRMVSAKAKEAGYSKPASEDLEEAAKNYADEEEYGDDVYYSIKATFKEGANWQKEQFEKNRLAACDAQIPEEAEREMNFATNIIEKEHRMPTYDDAIKYGMRLQKEEMIKDAINAEVAVPVYEGKDIKLTQLVTTDVKLNAGDKIKLIIIKD